MTDRSTVFAFQFISYHLRLSYILTNCLTPFYYNLLYRRRIITVELYYLLQLNIIIEEQQQLLQPHLLGRHLPFTQDYPMREMLSFIIQMNFKNLSEVIQMVLRPSPMYFK